MNPLTRRATLRHVELIERRKSPVRRIAERVNPMFAIGAFLAGCAIWIVVNTIVAEPQIVGECRIVRSVQA